MNFEIFWKTVLNTLPVLIFQLVKGRIAVSVPLNNTRELVKSMYHRRKELKTNEAAWPEEII